MFTAVDCARTVLPSVRLPRTDVNSMVTFPKHSHASHSTFSVFFRDWAFCFRRNRASCCCCFGSSPIFSGSSKKSFGQNIHDYSCEIRASRSSQFVQPQTVRTQTKNSFLFPAPIRFFSNWKWFRMLNRNRHISSPIISKVQTYQVGVQFNRKSVDHRLFKLCKLIDPLLFLWFTNKPCCHINHPTWHAFTLTKRVWTSCSYVSHKFVSSTVLIRCKQWTQTNNDFERKCFKRLKSPTWRISFENYRLGQYLGRSLWWNRASLQAQKQEHAQESLHDAVYVSSLDKADHLMFMFVNVPF